MDCDSSDEESCHRPKPFYPRAPVQNRTWIFENNNEPIVDQIEEESSIDDSNLNSSQIFGQPKKRLHTVKDYCAAHCHKNCQYSTKPKRRKCFWSTQHHDCQIMTRMKEESPLEQDSSSEYISEAYVDKEKSIENYDEDIINIEEFINYTALIPTDFFEEEIPETSSHAQQTESYLFETESEEIIPENFAHYFPNGMYMNQFQTLSGRMVE